MKLIKIMNGKDVVIDLPENVARQMLRTQSAYKEIKKEVEQPVIMPAKIQEPIKRKR